MILALREPGDSAIEIIFAYESRILHNTIFYKPGLKHEVPWSIGYRFPPTSHVTIRNNLSNLPIRMRSPQPQKPAVTDGNMNTAGPGWFRAVWDEDVHLVSRSMPIDRGVFLSGPQYDFDGCQRLNGSASDVGADEYGKLHVDHHTTQGVQ